MEKTFLEIQQAEEIREELMSKLQSSPLFFDLNRKDLNAIAGFSQFHRYASGKTLVSEGDEHGSDLFLPMSGQLKISLKGVEGAGAEEVVLTPQQMRMFGEVACVLQRKRTATVFCVSPVEAVVIDGRQLHDFMEGNPGPGYLILKNMFESLVERLRATNSLLRNGMS